MANAKFLRVGAPIPISVGSTTPTFANTSFDNTGDKLAWIIQVVDALTITKLGFRYGARANTPPTFKISLQGVDASGLPDGTVLGGGSPASATFTPPADASWDGTWQWVTLDNSYLTTRGQLLCIVIEHSSGAFTATDSTFTHIFSGVTGNLTFPYYAVKDGAGAFAKTMAAADMVYGYATASQAYGVPAQGYSVAATAATNGHKHALKFKIDSDFCDSYKVVGVRLAMAGQTAAKSFVVSLRQTDDTVLQNVTIDTDQIITSTVGRAREFYFDESSLSTLSAGTFYRLCIEVDATAMAVGMHRLQFASSGDADAMPGGSTNFLFSSYDGSSWTDDATQRPVAELILADITEPSGGGGGIIIGSVSANIVQQCGVVGY